MKKACGHTAQACSRVAEVDIARREIGQRQAGQVPVESGEIVAAPASGQLHPGAEHRIGVDDRCRVAQHGRQPQILGRGREGQPGQSRRVRRHLPEPRRLPARPARR